MRACACGANVFVVGWLVVLVGCVGWLHTYMLTNTVCFSSCLYGVRQCSHPHKVCLSPLGEGTSLRRRANAERRVALLLPVRRRAPNRVVSTRVRDAPRLLVDARERVTAT